MLFDRASIIFKEEITTAIASINKRKSADFHSLTIEHILHAGENIITVLTHILSTIFLEGDIPEVLKIGLLSPIFKNKGLRREVQYVHFAFRRLIFCMLLRQVEQHSWATILS
jgi:hypothetical protein